MLLVINALIASLANTQRVRYVMSANCHQPGIVQPQPSNRLLQLKRHCVTHISRRLQPTLWRCHIHVVVIAIVVPMDTSRVRRVLIILMDNVTELIIGKR